MLLTSSEHSSLVSSLRIPPRFLTAAVGVLPIAVVAFHSPMVRYSIRWLKNLISMSTASSSVQFVEVKVS
jgi:hypothetical protein